MRRKTEQPSFLRRHFRTVFLVAVIALAIHDVFGPHGFLAMKRTQREIAQLTAEIHQLNDQNQALTDEVNALKTDPRLIERIAREDMGLAKPNEFIFKMPDTQNDTTSKAPAKNK